MSVPVRSRVIVVLCLAAIACAKPAQTERSFDLHGQILAVRPNNEVLVKHDDIRGFMPAMTMPYRVRRPELLAGVAAGDLIRATLVVGENDAWLARIEKVGTAPLPPPERDAVSGVTTSLLRTGDAAPDDELIDHEGQRVSLEQWRGSPVAITFIYTRCPLPQYCPLMDRRFAEVQRMVKADPLLAGRAKLLSVSFDPEHDTAAVLETHATRLGADPGVWRFATAPIDVVDPFAKAFGIAVMREADKTITHNLRTAVLDPEGRLVSIYDGSAWTPDQIVTDMKRVVAR